MTAAERPTSRRAPAGAAVLQRDVTLAIQAAVFAELAEHGYGRMSIEAVARRAGVGKTAIYRRWNSKLQMVIDVVSTAAVKVMPVPDTGSLRGDIRELLDAGAQAMRHPLASQIVPDLLAEAARNPDIAETLEKALRETQQGVSAVMIGNAVERGELPADTDVELALDMVFGPLYWRVAVTRSPVSPDYLDRLAQGAAAALVGAHGVAP
ncbi:TetR/AcrR family transcriptional regulator [Streptomonospora sp. S1-112]|uniref:TetR/AcrR family transcriptional regulator n=1 Tax=Streptomonospora mangrovi TaxID=2883123 RepID=A0A9X3NMI6_9ACTN|nr:TetR/AcrR family transcriptional regulator [Streptomonospora mangrovi]MDA0566048.1 TetR/AcrR family transcriptional regulator [Streptomonospora mangrovi]